MIKIIEQGQKTFIRTCNRCGCKFQYDLSDLSGLDYISCPCCHTTLTHIGPHSKKVGPNDTDLSKSNKIDWIDTGKINVDDIRKHTTTTPYKVEVGDASYNYITTTDTQYADPNVITTLKANEVTEPSIIVGGDPNATICINNISDTIKDNCCYESNDYKTWYNEWRKELEKESKINVKNNK